MEDDSLPRPGEPRVAEALPVAADVAPLPGFLSFLCDRMEGDLPAENQLENVRHLPLLSDGPFFSVRDDIRSTAQGKSLVCKVFKKVFTPSSANLPTASELRHLLRELTVLTSPRQAKSENLIALSNIRFAIVSSDPVEICPVFKFERATHGSLEVFQLSTGSVDLETRSRICADITSGVIALQALGFVHGSLNPSHVLVFSHPRRKYQAKLCGFGNCFTAADFNALPVTPNPWHAPEKNEGSTREDEIFKCDVFSLGLLLWQVLVHRDPFAVFDLPIDAESRNAELLEILRLPYLFRFIPLFIEHSHGHMLQDDIFDTVDKLFACSVRINPARRNIDEVRRLVEKLSGRELPPISSPLVKDRDSTTPLDSTPRSPAEPGLNMYHFKFTAKHIRMLPWIVQSQLLESLRTIAAADSGAESIPDSAANEAVWLEFLCYFYGFGTRLDSSLAKRSLDKLASRGIKLANTLLTAIICAEEASDSGSPTSDLLTDYVQRLELLNTNASPPWRTQTHGFLKTPEGHGIEKGINFVRDLCAKGNYEESIGGNNTILHAACVFGLIEELPGIIQRAPSSLYAKNDNGDTALSIACQTGQTRIVQRLLLYGADASVLNNRDESGLHWLSAFPEHERPTGAMELVQAGAPIGRGMPDKPTGFAAVCPRIEAFNDGRIPGNALLRAVVNRDLISIPMLVMILISPLEILDPDAQLYFISNHVFTDAIKLACELHLFDVLELLLEQLRESLAEIEEMPAETRDMVRQLSANTHAVGQFHQVITNTTGPLRAALDTDFHLLRLYCHGPKLESAAHATLAVLERFGFMEHLVIGTVDGPLDAIHYAIRLGNTAAVEFFLSRDRFRSMIDAADRNLFTLVDEALFAHQFEILALLARQGATLDLRNGRDPRHRLTGSKASYLHVLGSLRINERAFVELLLDSGVPATVADFQNYDALSMALARASFGLARILIDNGASLMRQGVLGVTPLGDLFMERTAAQFDDRVATLRFLLSLSYEKGLDLFICNRESGYSAIHVAAAHPLEDPSYRETFKMLLQYFHKPEQLDAKAQNPAKSTALQMAMWASNDVAVELLVDAGVDVNTKDWKGKTCLDIALEGLGTLVAGPVTGSREDHKQKIGRVVNIVRLLGQKTGWPGRLSGFHTLSRALMSAEPLVERMHRSAHQVSFMRQLEKDIFAIVGNGYTEIIKHGDMILNALLKHIVEQWAKGAVRVDLDCGVVWHRGLEVLEPSDSYETVRGAIPWCKNLVNARLQDFQRAAAFEWVLDTLLQRDQDEASRSANDLHAFARTRDVSDLIAPNLLRYPETLLEAYKRILEKEEVTFRDNEKAQIGRFLNVLRLRQEAIKAKNFPLPEFDDEFQTFHFKTLQPVPLELSTALVTVQVVIRCRCYAPGVIGPFSKSDMVRFTKRATSVDAGIWASRVVQFRKFKRELCQSIQEWKSSLEVVDKCNDISLLPWILQANDLLGYPRPEERPDEPQKNKPSGILPWPKLGIDYKPLNAEDQELRLLTLHHSGASAQEGDLVSCSMDHFCFLELSTQYRAFRDSVDSATSLLEETLSWEKHVTTVESETGDKISRYSWGDFSTLSYTWGSRDDLRPILLNGTRVLIGANLEAALRVLREQDDFRGGLKLWVDAICLNQEDLDEKARLLPYMQHFYRISSKVVVWLGPDDSLQPLTTVRSFLKEHVPASVLATLSMLAASKAAIRIPKPVDFVAHVLPALLNIMNRPYWMRLWIMQEITTTAYRKDVYLGRDKISMAELGILFSIYAMVISRRDGYATDDVDERTVNAMSGTVGHILSLLGQDEVYASSKGFGSDNTGILVGDWTNYIYLGGLTEVSDERDRVYGLLGLMQPWIVEHIKPDYKKSAAQVYVDLSKAIVTAMGSFDDLLIGTASRSVDGLPSWGVNLRETGKLLGQHNKAPGYLSPVAAFYATRKFTSVFNYDIPEQWKPSFAFSPDDNMLTVRAVKVDTIDGTSGPIYRTGTRSRILDIPVKHPAQPPIPNSDASDAAELLAALARIIKGDLHDRSMHGFFDTAGGSAPSLEETHTALFSIPWFEGSTLTPVEEDDLIAVGWAAVLRLENFVLFHLWRCEHADFPVWGGLTLRDYFPASTAELRKRGTDGLVPVAAVVDALVMVRMIETRALITTASRRWLGSTSADVRKGDPVVIVPGCSFPVLLRSRPRAEEDGNSDDEDLFEVVGECYIEGLMNGEVVEWVEKGELQMEDLRLV